MVMTHRVVRVRTKRVYSVHSFGGQLILQNFTSGETVRVSWSSNVDSFDLTSWRTLQRHYTASIVTSPSDMCGPFSRVVGL
jgi:hypothetical protein